MKKAKATRKAKARKAMRARRPTPRAGEDVYLRFGDLPEGGRSRNYRTGRLEPGVSVYRATKTPEAPFWRKPRSAHEAHNRRGRQTCSRVAK